MDPHEVGRVVLMSIHPVYGQAILRGDKLVEFRKRPIPADVTHVIMYATRPIGAIIGAFSVASQVTLPPATLWKQFKDIGGIERDLFLDYFHARSEGTVIAIGNTFQALDPLSIHECFGLSRPPQSFQFVATRKAHEIIEEMWPLRRGTSNHTYREAHKPSLMHANSD